MKPVKEDQQLRSVSLAYSVALPAFKPKSLHEEGRRAWVQAPISPTERSGEVFFLDILSHRMSEMAILQQPSPLATANSIAFIDLPVSQT